MNLDEAIISYTVKNDALGVMQRAGISEGDFIDEYRTVWRFLLKAKRDHDEIPSGPVLRTRYPDLRLPRVEERDVAMLLRQMRQRRKYKEFLTSLTRAAERCSDFEQVDGAIQFLQADLNTLYTSNQGRSHLVDLFSADTTRTMRRELRRRRSGQTIGMASGLAKFDSMAGGLQKQKMVTIIGRPGQGKSWLDLLFVASAVIGGAKVILYPLEMTLFETAARLYTLFSQQMFGQRHVLKNYDLTTGRINTAKVVRFLHVLEDKFPGQLYVADVAQLADPYTNERIEAEVEIHRPDMFWVDYLTLLKPPAGGKGDGDWAQVRQLSNGIKNTAMRRNCVGGCSAQVNREALKVKTFLPRLEHIAYGDSIGQDADQVFSLNRNSKGLWYALVKNRGGPEIGKTCIKFDVNSGVLREIADSEAEDEDEADAG